MERPRRGAELGQPGPEADGCNLTPYADRDRVDQMPMVPVVMPVMPQGIDAPVLCDEMLELPLAERTRAFDRLRPSVIKRLTVDEAKAYGLGEGTHVENTGGVKFTVIVEPIRSSRINIS